MLAYIVDDQVAIPMIPSVNIGITNTLLNRCNYDFLRIIFYNISYWCIDIL